MVIKYCKKCGKLFKVFPYRKNTAFFCSRKCREKYGYSKETIKKMSEVRLGKKLSKETREKMSKSAIKSGTGKWNKGRKLSKHHKDNIRKALKQSAKWHLSMKNRKLPFGRNHHNWKGGISKIDKLCRMMPEYKKWKTSIFERDNWTCQTCNKRGVYITAHHIKGFSKIIKENNVKGTLDARKCKELWNLKNGITLCEECHKLTDNYKGRANSK